MASNIFFLILVISHTQHYIQKYNNLNGILVMKV